MVNTENKSIMFDPPHPGEVLKELYISSINVTLTELADALGVTRKTISSIVNKKQGISPQMALRLSKSFNTSPDLWLNLQMQYDLWQAKQNFNFKQVKVMV